MREGTIFELAVKPAQFPAGLRLRNLEWGVLFAINGATPVGLLARTFSLEAGEITRICELLLEKGLIREREVTLTEYMAAQTAGHAQEPVSLAELLQGAKLPAEQPRSRPETAPLKVAAPLPISMPVPAVSPVIKKVTPTPVPELVVAQFSHAAAARPAVTQPPQQAVAPSTPHIAPAKTSPAMHSESSTARRLSLKNLIAFIMDRAPNLTAGQLDVYRVFIRVNTRLLRRNGINSLRFEEDRLITDAELQQAITASVQQTTGTPCPEAVFV